MIEKKYEYLEKKFKCRKSEWKMEFFVEEEIPKEPKRINRKLEGVDKVNRP